ncbi:MAG: Arc family DNA-binding protein [Anaerolineae bacterium]|nr:Arc family DNA-binding protein [Anaerolineae bacterium]
MTDLLIRQLPDELHTRLKLSAKANRRSVNQEVLFLLERSLEETKVETPLPGPLEGTVPMPAQGLGAAREEGRA